MKGVTIYKPKVTRFLTAKEAATYLGYDTVSEFKQQCSVEPQLRSGKLKYDVALLDEAEEYRGKPPREMILARLQ